MGLCHATGRLCGLAVEVLTRASDGRPAQRGARARQGRGRLSKAARARALGLLAAAEGGAPQHAYCQAHSPAPQRVALRAGSVRGHDGELEQLPLRFRSGGHAPIDVLPNPKNTHLQQPNSSYSLGLHSIPCTHGSIWEAPRFPWPISLKPTTGLAGIGFPAAAGLFSPKTEHLCG